MFIKEALTLMETTLLNLSLKDWFIAFTLFILILCVRQIRLLKKSIARETQKRLIPQLLIELIPGVDKIAGLYLSNESPFLVRNVRIEDSECVLEDYGFGLRCFLHFEPIGLLKPHEKIKLFFKVVDKKGAVLEKITEAVMPHLVTPSFKIKIVYANIENLEFKVIFAKKKQEFLMEHFEQIIKGGKQK